jgi:5-methylcytosine-specific restriction protein A
MHERAYQAAFDKLRKSARARGYDAKWEKTRVVFLEYHPKCMNCRVFPAVDVDHIIAKRDGGSDEWNNLRSLCHSCHSARTGRDQGHFRRRN